MQQRYYDPRVGRFWSVDPVTVDSVGGNFNRYWYANNNPYRFTDPDGRQAKEGYEFDTCGITGCNSGSFNESRRSEEHTSELQSLMRISYAVFCLKKKKSIQLTQNHKIKLEHQR